jgi:hypothetical protein
LDKQLKKDEWKAEQAAIIEVSAGDKNKFLKTLNKLNKKVTVLQKQLNLKGRPRKGARKAIDPPKKKNQVKPKGNNPKKPKNNQKSKRPQTKRGKSVGN